MKRVIYFILIVLIGVILARGLSSKGRRYISGDTWFYGGYQGTDSLFSFSEDTLNAYNALQISDSLTGYNSVLATTISDSLSIYYTKTEANSMVSDSLSIFYTKSETNSTISDSLSIFPTITEAKQFINDSLGQERVVIPNQMVVQDTLHTTAIQNNYIDFDQTYSGTHTTARLHWDDDHGTLEIGMKGDNVNLQVGQEGLMRVKNVSGALINNGQPVYIVSASGSPPFAHVDTLDITNINKSFMLGLATEDISNNNHGYIALWGTVTGEATQPINTSAYAEGTALWAYNNSSGWVDWRPEADSINVFVGQVVRQHATEGVIVIRPTVIPRLQALSDIYGTPSIDGDGYLWSTTNSRFEKANFLNKYYVTYEDTILYVVKKFNATRDLIYSFTSSGNNDLFTFKEVGLYSNTADYPSRDLTRTRLQSLISNDGSDSYPAPIQIDGEFAGGNHLSPSTTHKTAYCASKEIFADGVQITTGMSGYYDEIVIKTHNEILDPNDIESGYRQVILNEYCTMRLNGQTIEVETQHVVQDTSFLCNNYYGMQEYGFFNADSIYFAHSDSTYWQVDNGSQNSGALNSYPNTEKMILKDIGMNTAVQLYIDLNYGLPANVSIYIDDDTATQRIFQNSSKSYYHLIDNVTISANTVYGFRGSYSFIDFTDIVSDNRIISSNMFYRNGQPILSVDVLDTVQVEVPKELRPYKINESYIDSDLTLGQNVFNSYLDVISNDTYGNCYLEINPFNSSLNIEDNATIGGNIDITGSTTLDGSSVTSSDVSATNTFYGSEAGNTTGTGTENTFIGYRVARNHSTASNNTVVGSQTGFQLTSGSRNTFMGFAAGQLSTSGADNVAMGYYALAVAKGNYNTAIGRDALYGYSGATGTDGNVAVGRFAGRYIGANADNNIFIGYGCVDESNVTGSNNIVIGEDQQLATTSTDSSLVIGVTAGDPLITADMTVATDDSRELTVDAILKHQVPVAKFFRDSAYTFSATNTWETIPFKEVYGDLNTSHFSYNADSTGIVVSDGMKVRINALLRSYYDGSSVQAAMYARIVKGRNGSTRVYTRCGQNTNIKLKESGDRDDMKLCSMISVNANDTIFVQAYSDNANFNLSPVYTPFENVITGALIIEYLGDY